MTLLRSLLIALLLYVAMSRASLAREGQLELSAIDRDTGQPIAVRVHLQNIATRRPVRPPGVPVLGDHFVFYDKIQLKLPLGSYKFAMERGPEYLIRTGHFTINNYANDRKTVDMKRFVNMAAEGWYAGDLDVYRREQQLELLMQAEDLYVAMLAESKPSNRVAADDGVTRFDGTRFFARRAMDDDLPLPFSWDVPLRLATNNLDSLQVAHRHLRRDGVVDHEADGRPRDRSTYPGLLGNGYCSTDIYYHLLNCGLRLPPTAGSGSGWEPPKTAQSSAGARSQRPTKPNFNPVGYNRVYAFVEGDLTWVKWWDALRAGRTVVTNGPLIRPSVEGHPPGHIFHADAGETLELEIGLSLSTRDKISYLEVIQNGRTAHSSRLDQWKQNQGKLPPLKFTESGWFLIRAVADEPTTYRFAMTAPYYVQIGDQPRISRTSAQFFVDWCAERSNVPVRQAYLSAETEPGQSIAQWRRAEEYWTTVLKNANAP
jgi:hypothetical protein